MQYLQEINEFLRLLSNLRPEILMRRKMSEIHVSSIVRVKGIVENKTILTILALIFETAFYSNDSTFSESSIERVRCSRALHTSIYLGMLWSAHCHERRDERVVHC